MAPITTLSHLLNPLTTPSHLETTSSQLDGIPKPLEDSIRFETSRLLQAAGILIHLPQEIIAQAIIILQRFWSGPEGGSMLDYDPKDVAAASLYLTAKPSATPVSPRRVLTTFAFLSSLPPGELSRSQQQNDLEIQRIITTTTTWHFSEGTYERSRNKLYKIEMQILKTLGFQTHVALPQPLCINYLQTLDVFSSSSVSVAAQGPAVAKRAFQHLNSALLSPQLVYLTHQPHALAVSAIYLAARELGLKLPGVEWWEVFDVDREELGFLVVALRSVEGFAAEERVKWEGRKVPCTVDELREEIRRAE